ncbi:MAG: hypothetical protein M3209_01900 [Acidobacteriota bacterium]|nr:hypothetical protein [Acidobacteriota bacterium]
MKNSSIKTAPANSERGSAGVKFLIVIVVLFLVGRAGFAYIPAAYQAEDYKQRMNELVTNAFAMPNSPGSNPEVIKQRLRSYGNDYGIPLDALIKVDKMDNGGLKVQVKFAKQIELLPFSLYNYTYEFDHTATPNGFLTKG